MPPARHRSPARARRQAHPGAPVRALLTGLCELAAVRHPAQNPRPGLFPGQCKGKAHRRQHLGYAGRRVLVSRKWSGKTLADHRGDRKAWLTEMLGIPPADPGRYRWQLVTPTDPDHMPYPTRLLRAIADRLQWENALTEARRRAQEAAEDLSAAGRAA